MIPVELIISLFALFISVLSMIFIVLPYLNSLKPQLRIEIKDKKEIQSCLEWGDLVLSITNISDNTARDIKIELISEIEIMENSFKQSIGSKDEIPYLHPREVSQFPLKSIFNILEEAKDLFEIKKKRKDKMIVPKKNLVINLRVKVSSERYKTYDDFYIEWHSMNSSPSWEAPRILCWNRRKDKYIIKKKNEKNKIKNFKYY